MVGEHIGGKVVLNPLSYPENAVVPLGGVLADLRARRSAAALRPTDSNAATHLIRNSLGGSAYGVDHDRLSRMLTLPQDTARMYRDDITVCVVHFDGDYLRNVKGERLDGDEETQPERVAKPPPDSRD